MVDLDRDGHLDLITGSYPGEIYVFPGLAEGGFGACRTLEDEDGDAINLGSASAVFAYDWDGDGDLDLVVGDIHGQVYFVPNESGGDALALGEAEALEAGEETIRVPGGDAGPCLADWDGDGTVDLIVGCGNGSVRLYANRTEKGMPSLAAPVDLLEAPRGGMGLKEGEPIRCGARAKPCVVDWNGDGHLDLLVGDVISVRPPPRELDDEEQASKRRLEWKRDWVIKRLIPASERVQKRVYEALGVETEGLLPREIRARLTTELQKEFSARYRELLRKDIEAAALSRMLREVSQALRPFQPRASIHGHVWVLLRSAP